MMVLGNAMSRAGKCVFATAFLLAGIGSLNAQTAGALPASLHHQHYCRRRYCSCIGGCVSGRDRNNWQSREVLPIW